MYDVKKHVTSVDTGSLSALPKKETPKFVVHGHKNEGFALDWSPTVPGRSVY